VPTPALPRRWPDRRLEQGRQLRPAGDAELAEDARQVALDGLGGEEQLAGDLAGGLAGGGQFGDVALTGGQRLQSGPGATAGASPRSPELVERPLGQDDGTELLRGIERTSERRARVPGAARPAVGDPQHQL
jgi:hypothetical protein